MHATKRGRPGCVERRAPSPAPESRGESGLRHAITCVEGAPLTLRFAQSELLGGSIDSSSLRVNLGGYGVKYPLIVRAVSFGESMTTRTRRYWFALPKSEIWYLIANCARRSFSMAS